MTAQADQATASLEDRIKKLEEKVAFLEKGLLERMAAVSVSALDAGSIKATTLDADIIKARGMTVGAAMPPNLIRNSWMDLVQEVNGKNVPVGYGAAGNLSLEAVHPFTMGFEGPYTPEPPTPRADTVDTATEGRPYWFSRYNKGPRVTRGGLADGWHSFGSGRILKITGDNSGTHSSVAFPFEPNVLVRIVRFTAWVKIVRGALVCFGNDAGYGNTWTADMVTREQASTAPQGWYRVNMMIEVSVITLLQALAFSMGIQGEGPGGTVEVYLALPYLANLDHDAWLPSVSDMMRRA